VNDLWEQLHDLFEADDGSLPDVFIEELTSDQIRAVYQWIRSRCDPYCDEGTPVFWDRREKRNVPIDSVDDPSALVVAGRAEPFRQGLSRFAIAGVELPPLTIAVWPDRIDLDYRMGSDWGAAQLSAFFELLWVIQQMAPNAQISHACEGGSRRTESFATAWKEYQRFRSHGSTQSSE
jgi:hypothetical protein